MKIRNLFVAVGMALSVASMSQGTVSQSISGLSGMGVPVSFSADLTISGDTLTIVLCNNSTQSLNPSDLLSSYFFDIVNGMNNRPNLTYVSAVGDVWLTDKNAPDTLSTAGANVRAVNAGDNTWQFKTLNASLNPFIGFGLGTVGNSNLTPNNFNGNIVDGMDYSIYAGDVTTSNLDNRLLTKGCITFTFSGVSGFTEADISSLYGFGLGTAPDSLLITPAPGSLALLMLGGGLVVRRRRN